MVSIVFDAFTKLLQQAMQQYELDWKRDSRDPTAIGEVILNRSKDETACQAADRAELMLLPKYR